MSKKPLTIVCMIQNMCFFDNPFTNIDSCRYVHLPLLTVSVLCERPKRRVHN